MNINEIKQLLSLITGRNNLCLYEFSEKELINIFIKSGISIERINYFKGDYKYISEWLILFFREISEQDDFYEILKNIIKEVTFYNPEIKDKLNNFVKLSEKNLNVGIFMDFGEKNKEYLFNNVFKKAIEEIGLKANRVDEIANPGENIHETIQRMITEFEYFIIDISGEGKNKFIELGGLLALNKKIILLKEKNEKWTFNINNLNTIVYDLSNADPEKQKEGNDELLNNIKNALEKLKK